MTTIPPKPIDAAATIQKFLDEIREKGAPQKQVCGCDQHNVAFSNWDMAFARAALPKAGEIVELVIKNLPRIKERADSIGIGAIDALMKDIARILEGE